MIDTIVRTQDMNLHLKSGGSALHILKAITFAINPGEVVSVVGPSGSGKTSLLMVLGGLEKASDGVVAIGETNLAGLDEDQLADMRRQNIGILFQNFHLIPSMTALENVALALEIAFDDLPVAEIRARARAALAEVGLAERETHLPSALSGGEQQRVGLARAIVTRPKLLLADEPTGNLDQETAASAIDLLFSLARRNNMAVMLITHDSGLAMRADRRMRMDHGELRELEAAVA
ncbi:putative ABC transport system ATP-binding protein [Devosia subaequoris]|uniref:Putative ABC transport system ATP-binding protein n=1 Tax=Devosia subaequoris TaxID=395930 RepID=A0A7W6IKL0_9HYPH|nr:ABC transporter ATP-binding protein [Devosia subaequoris]MBB4051346.1 putative ABC transport system ATP-binding protein [Devosia subaequoris]MCP1208943.1 ABC transporter ATP-binding protein [Devosia subaequoris]